MFTLASPANIIISTLVFFIAARYFRHYLEAQGLPKGITRGTLIFALAFLMSWASGEMVDWAQEKMAEPKQAGQPQPVDTE